MARKILHRSRSAVWQVVHAQHEVITRVQLLDLGFSSAAIEHRLDAGRLHPLWKGVYAVGRPEVSREGLWMAAVLACGDGALLSHASAAVLWKLRPERGGRIEASVPGHVRRKRPGIVIHRRTGFRAVDVARRGGIPVTSPVATLVDIAPGLEERQLKSAINAADKLDLVDAERLRREIEGLQRPGAPRLRRLLDRESFTVTDSELEILFLPIARRAGLGLPETGAIVNGFKVDFFWSELGLVVETDGLRYHRTPAEQARDRLRDQVHTAAGLVPLRFTRSQVKFEPRYVEGVLRAVARRLAG